MKESAAFIAGTKQGVQTASAKKNPELPEGFKESMFKGQVREGHPRVWDQLLHNSLIG